MKTIAGRPSFAIFLVVVKSSATFRSASPSHLDIIDAASTERKEASISVATAAASKVLPQPGGPKRRIPLGHPNGKRSGL